MTPPREANETRLPVTKAGYEPWLCSPKTAQLLATGDYVGRLIVWPAFEASPKPKLSFEAHDGSIRAVSVSPDGNTIASAGNDGMVRLWSANDGKNLLELSGHDCHVYHTAFHPDGKSLVSADLKGVVKHWEFPSGKLVRELDATLLHTYSEKYSVDVGGIRGMSFNADGSKLACTGGSGEKGIAHSGSARVLLFDFNSGKLTNALEPGHTEICTAWGVKFHPDGFIIGSGGSRTGGYLWFWQPGENVAFHQGEVQTARSWVRSRYGARPENSRRSQSRWRCSTLGNGAPAGRGEKESVSVLLAASQHDKEGRIVSARQAWLAKLVLRMQSAAP